MIRNMGHNYTVKLDVAVEIDVTGRGWDEAEEKAAKAVEAALKSIGAEAEAEVVGMERGEEALDITEED